jgi:hypothetical protein
MISKTSAIIILDLLDKRIDEINERIATHPAVEGDENLIIRMKWNAGNRLNRYKKLLRETGKLPVSLFTENQSPSPVTFSRLPPSLL